MKFDDLKSFVNAYREAIPYLAIGIQISAIVVIFVLAGKYADDKLSTTPWLLLLGIFIGIFASFYHFFKTINQLNKKNKE